MAIQFLRMAFSLLVAAAPVFGAEPALDMGEGRQPQVAVSGSNAFLAFGGPNNEIMFQRVETGTSEGRKPSVIAKPPHIALGMRRGPRIAAAADALVVTAISGERGGGKDGDVIAWRSTDEGRTWGRLPEPLNSEPGAAREGLHALASGPGGVMVCVWLDLRHATAAAGGTEIWGAVSQDGGAHWSKDLPIYQSPEKTVCQCCHPSVSIDLAGTISVMFRNALGGNRDMYRVDSKDNGKSFGKASRIGEKSWALDTCPMDGGSIASGKLVTSVWRRASDVYAATPGSSTEVLIGKGQQPAITVDDLNESYIAWIVGRPGDLMLKRGKEAPERVAVGASDPSIASGRDPGSPVILAWESGAKVMVLNVRPEGKK